MNSLPINDLQPLTPAIDEKEFFYERVRRHYDSLSLPYRLFWGEHLHHGLFLNGHESPSKAQLQMVEYCLSLLPSMKGSRVLEIK